MILPGIALLSFEYAEEDQVGQLGRTAQAM